MGQWNMVRMTLSTCCGRYHRLGQPTEIKIKLNRSVDIMVDGEAWREEPGTITFRHKGKVNVAIGDICRPRGADLESESMVFKQAKSRGDDELRHEDFISEEIELVQRMKQREVTDEKIVSDVGPAISPTWQMS